MTAVFQNKSMQMCKSMEMTFGRSRYGINTEIGKQFEGVQGNFLERDYVKIGL